MSRLRKTAAWLKNDIKLNPHHPSSTFYHGQWDSGRKDGQPTVRYLIFRFLFMVTLISCTSYILTCPGKIFYVFLTYWNMFTQTFYATLYFLYIVWRKCPYFAQRCRSRGQVMDEEQQVPIPVRDVIIPSEIGSADVVPTRASVEMVIPTDFNPTSSQSVVINSDDNNNDAGAVRVTIPAGYHKFSNDNVGGQLTCLEKVICILMAVTQTIPFIVALVYWTKVYEYQKFRICKAISNWYITHSATAIFALIDSLVVAVPARLTHFIFPASFISIYMLFNYTYEQAGGRYRVNNATGLEDHFIYKELNWKDTPRSALVFAVLSVLGTCLFHTIIRWGIYKIKHKIVSRLSKASGD